MKNLKKLETLVAASLLCLLISPIIAARTGNSEIEIAAVGDILLDRGVRRGIEKFGIEYPFGQTRKFLLEADLAFGNLENPITDECHKVSKKYSFRADPAYAEILRRAGLDILSLANNHAFDCGKIGLNRTMDILADQNLRYVGAIKKRGGSSTTVVEIKGVKIGFAAFTAIAPKGFGEHVAAISAANPFAVSRKIAELRKTAHVVVVSFHWGTEYASWVNHEQEALAKLAVRSGADLVLGHHPHVLQGIQLFDRGDGKRKALVAYSLGNFVFDSPARFQRRVGESAILRVRVDRKGLVGAEMQPVVIKGNRPSIPSGDEQDRILGRIQKLSKSFGTEIREGRIEGITDKTSDPKQGAFETDLDGDGKVERVVLEATKEKSLRVFRGKKLLWEAVPSKWKPWKLMIADVDGDGKREVIVGVFKSTKFFQKPHNCLFIYSWSGEKGFPKWLGSSLGRPFKDFVFVDLEDYPGDELVAVETTLAGQRGLAVYHWNSFGFTKYQDFGPWRDAEILKTKEQKIYLNANGGPLVINLKRSWRN